MEAHTSMKPAKAAEQLRNQDVDAERTLGAFRPPECSTVVERRADPKARHMAQAVLVDSYTGGHRFEWLGDRARSMVQTEDH